MTTLNRTLAFAEVDTIAVLIRHYLNLDMARTFDETLDVNVAVFERGRRFGRGSLQRAR